MLTFDVLLATAEEQPAAVVHGHVTEGEISTFLGAAFDEVLRTMEAQWLAPAGPPFGRYTPTGDGFDVTAGFPASGNVAPAGRVQPETLPGGRIATVLYRGDYSGVAQAYDALYAWVSAQGYEPAGPPWESYLDDPGVAEPRTVVHLPCRLA